MKTVGVRCPRCANLEQVDSTATSARCPSCAARWRWAICGTCDELNVPFEWDEAWRCRSCGATNRSWWRTPDAARREPAIRRRRAKEAESGLRPYLIGAGVLVVVLVIGVIYAIPHTSAAEKRRQASGPACITFDKLKSEEANGSLGLAEVRSRADAIARAAVPGTTALNGAAQRLLAAATSTGPGSDDFLAAETAMDEACEAARR